MAIIGGLRLLSYIFLGLGIRFCMNRTNCRANHNNVSCISGWARRLDPIGLGLRVSDTLEYQQ